MKKIYYLIFTIAILQLFACESYLSELPDDRAVLTSKEKIKLLLVGAYPEGNYMLITELMSDNSGDRELTRNTEPLDEAIYTWNDTNLEGQDTPLFYWASCYKAIAHANQAIEALLELKDKKGTSGILGEALLTRAYAHFMLVNLWSEHYNPNTADTDLGVPYSFKSENKLIAKYKRNTVNEVYKFIEQDIEKGISLINNNYKNAKFRFTKEAAYAFASRFYLYKGDWKKVVDYSSKILSNPRMELKNWNNYSDLEYQEIAQKYFSIEEESNLLICSTQSWWGRNFYGPRFGFSSKIKEELFENKETNPYDKQWAYKTFGGEDYTNVPKFQEFFKYTNESASIGYGYSDIVLFSKDEVLLNRAEAYAMNNNFSSSLKDLKDFLSNKTKDYSSSDDDILTEEKIIEKYPFINNEFTPYYSLTEKQTSFVKAISEFKRREFVHEGLRWFDIKRFHLEIKHNLKDSEDLVLGKNDNRRLLQIPLVAVNKGLQKNNR